MPRQRITIKDLDRQLDRLNRTAGTPATPYTRSADGTLTPNAYHYNLSGAYGGWALHQFGAEGTGCRDVFRTGHIPARELYDRMAAFINGYLTCLAAERPEYATENAYPPPSGTQ